MSRYIVRRVAQLVPMLLLVGSLGFALVQLAPGGPVTALAGEFAHEDVQRELEERYRLDHGVVEQYIVYLSRFFRGELGVSYYFQRPVARVLWERLPATLLLVIPTLLLSTLLGTVLGIRLWGAVRGPHARGLLAAIAASNAVPVFWLAQILFFWFVVVLGWFPVQGMRDPRLEGSWVDLGAHLVLPILALTLHQVALITVLTWTGVERSLRRENAAAPTSHGLESHDVPLYQAFRSALPPLAATLGGRVGAIFAGAVLIETVFTWPGLGRLAVLASTNQDYPLVLGIFLLITTTVVLANFVADLLYAAVDRREGYR